MSTALTGPDVCPSAGPRAYPRGAPPSPTRSETQMTAGRGENEKEARDPSEAPSHLHLLAATISLYITHVIRRFGNRILNLSPPTAEPTTRLDLESRVLFAP